MRVRISLLICTLVFRGHGSHGVWGGGIVGGGGGAGCWGGGRSVHVVAHLHYLGLIVLMRDLSRFVMIQ